MSNSNQAKQPYITMTLWWQTDPYIGKKAVFAYVHTCGGWEGAAEMLCTFAIVGPPPWRKTIKPSVALPCSHYPPTWWVLRDHFFDSRHKSTKLNKLIRAQKAGEVRGQLSITSAHFNIRHPCDMDFLINRSIGLHWNVNLLKSDLKCKVNLHFTLWTKSCL